MKPSVPCLAELLAVEEKKLGASLLRTLKMCWPKIFPENARVAVLNHSELIPAFCSYAQGLFDGYLKTSDLTRIEFWAHVEAIQGAIMHRIVPEP
jgi:hypothetical protein